MKAARRVERARSKDDRIGLSRTHAQACGSDDGDDVNDTAHPGYPKIRRAAVASAVVSTRRNNTCAVPDKSSNVMHSHFSLYCFAHRAADTAQLESCRPPFRFCYFSRSLLKAPIVLSDYFCAYVLSIDTHRGQHRRTMHRARAAGLGQRRSAIRTDGASKRRASDGERRSDRGRQLEADRPAVAAIRLRASGTSGCRQHTAHVCSARVRARARLTRRRETPVRLN